MDSNTTHRDSSPTTLSEWFHFPSSSTVSSITKTPPILLMDGGVSTHLEQLIAPQTFSHRELWSSSLLLTEEGRKFIERGHGDWLQAGSDIITTVTYQCHFGLVKSKSTVDHQHYDNNKSNNNEVISQSTMSDMIQNGVLLARNAIQQYLDPTTTTTTTTTTSNTTDSSTSTTIPKLGPFVVASTGPYGAAMADGSEYTGAYPPHVTQQALKDFHQQKAKVLWDCHSDGLAVETIPNLQEVGVVCQVLKELQQEQEQKHQSQQGIASSGSGRRVCCCWISLACRNGTEMNDGNLLQDALHVIQSMDPHHQYIAAIGVNCCDSAHIPSLVNIIAHHVVHNSSPQTGLSPRGIVLYPNSGESWNASKNKWDDATGVDDTQFTDRLLEAVAIIQDIWDKRSVEIGSSSITMPRIILGGCCRTSDKTIATLRKRITIFNELFLQQDS
jgi:homocysteine S-methyltransferase